LCLTVDKIKEQNIKLQPDIRTVIHGNVNDFGEIYTDDFVFETSLKNDYREGSSMCQKTFIYLVADSAPTVIPLCAKGCVSDVDFHFAGEYFPGKKKDLSAFGDDFKDFVKVRIEAKDGNGKISFDDKLIYEGKIKKRSKILGIYFNFEGTGSVEFVKLTNGTVTFEDQFDRVQ
jgi:hypothetical protein